MRNGKCPGKIVCLFILLTCSFQMANAQKAPLNRSDNPGISREGIEWLDVWVDEGQTTKLPRVLLIGDSITRGYHKEVAKELSGRAAIARLATSKSASDPALIEEVSLLLREYKFEVIHFNNGNHGLDQSEEQYCEGLRELIRTIKKHAPGATLIWGTTTPIRQKEDLSKFSSKNPRVIDRNNASLAIMKQERISVDDLYALVKDHPEYYLPNDGNHFNAKGTEVEGSAVAKAISASLPSANTE